MPLFSYNPTGKYVWDSWGWSPRGDFVQVPGSNGRMYYGTSGETYTPEELAGQGVDQGELFDSPEAAYAKYGRQAPAPAAGVNQAENAYNASLRALGIDPSELPFGQYGQEMTARVFQKHGLALPDYLKPFADPNYSGGGGGGGGAGGGGDAINDPYNPGRPSRPPASRDVSNTIDTDPYSSGNIIARNLLGHINQQAQAAFAAKAKAAARKMKANQLSNVVPHVRVR